MANRPETLVNGDTNFFIFIATNKLIINRSAMRNAFIIGLVAVLPLMFVACDKIGIDKEDRIRFDFDVEADSVDIIIEDSLWFPYEEEELSRYKDQRDGIQEFEIRKVTFRFHTFEEDHADNIMRGRLRFRTPRNSYEIVPFETGNEYKDAAEHEIYSISVNGDDDKAAAYEALARDVVDYDSFHIERANGNFYPGPLKCMGAVYVYYRVKGT